MADRPSSVSRRRLLAYGVGGAGLLAVGGTIGTLAGRRLNHRAAGSADTNPFAYPVDPLSPVDARWLHFRQVEHQRVPFAQARRIAIGPDQRVYIGGDRRIGVFDGGLHPLAEVQLPDMPCCLAVAPEGDLFVGLQRHVLVYGPDGRQRSAWESPGPRTWLTGIAVAGDHVFVADAGARLVWHHDRGGKPRGCLGQPDPQRHIPGFVVPSPFFDLEIGSDGLLRVANPGRHRVEIYTFDGDLELAWGTHSLAVEGFSGCCNPINLAMLPDGRCITCEKGIPRVKLYAADGTLESVVAGPDSFKLNALACASADDCRHGGLDVAVDGDQRVLVLDLVAGDVRILTRRDPAAPSAAT